MKNQITQNTDSLVLINKKTGITSFRALNSVKKALKTTKVGHTGTLDSFAQGLLVVCVGHLTKLAGNITGFNKTYKAVIRFGYETDTLEFTGRIIKKTELPTLFQVQNAIQKFSGNLMQIPPNFSAIHINGKRASDLTRSGKSVEIPARSITVFSSKLLDVKMSGEKVKYAMIEFNVSKGTYIRSLARDIGTECNSSAHLVGLFRTKVGNFNIENAAGFSEFDEFSIKNSIKNAENFNRIQEIEQNNQENKKFVLTQEEIDFQNEIIQKKQTLSKETAKLCGFQIIHLKDENVENDFYNGKFLKQKHFIEHLDDFINIQPIAVFTKREQFSGLIEKSENKIVYKFVIHRI